MCTSDHRMTNRMAHNTLTMASEHGVFEANRAELQTHASAVDLDLFADCTACYNSDADMINVFLPQTPDVQTQKAGRLLYAVLSSAVAAGHLDAGDFADVARIYDDGDDTDCDIDLTVPGMPGDKRAAVLREYHRAICETQDSIWVPIGCWVTEWIRLRCEDERIWATLVPAPHK